MTDNLVHTGDHVWWGDPANPETGTIQTMSQNRMFAFIRKDSARKPNYVTLDVNQLHKMEATP